MPNALMPNEHKNACTHAQNISSEDRVRLTSNNFLVT